MLDLWLTDIWTRLVCLLIAERDVASGDGNAVREEIAEGNAARPSVMKWLKPR